MLKLINSQRTSHVCRVSPKETGNNAHHLGKSKDFKPTLDKFVKKRTETLKNNVNELLKISQVDLNEIGELAKELDVFHKSKATELKNAFLEKVRKEKVTKDESETVAQSVDDEVDGGVEGTEENIFLDK